MTASFSTKFFNLSCAAWDIKAATSAVGSSKPCSIAVGEIGFHVEKSISYFILFAWILMGTCNLTVR